MSRCLRVLLLATVVGLGAAGPAGARDVTVTSFDGTAIAAHFFPAAGLASGAKAPTVLFGPGWSSGGATDENGASDPGTGIVGVGPLRKAGFNVLTWDPRGFGKSGGLVSVDGPDFEGRDVQALIDFVAKQPEAQLDAPGDPRLGMSGGSYGGGIQLVAAGLDKRIDVIVPDIAWHSLGTSLYKDSTYKQGWNNILYALGKATGGHYDPHIDSSYESATATGALSDADNQWFLSRGPGDLVKNIHIPTLLMQGTVDTLFTLNEAITNYDILKANGVPLKMLWFCGGHGSCLTNPGDDMLFEKRAIEWLERYLKGDKSIDTGPGFEWVDQDGKEHNAAGYPVASAGALTATGSGTLPLTDAGGSGPATGGTGPTAQIAAPTNASKATNAVNVTTAPAKADLLVVGAPSVTLTYSGTATQSDARIYGQVVDDASGKVLGNLVAPIPVTLDGQSHTVTRPLEVVAHTLHAGQTLTVQFVADTTAYYAQLDQGAVTISKAAVSLPLVDPAVTPASTPAAAKRTGSLKIRAARLLRGRSVRVRLTGRAHEVTVTVRNRHGKVVGRRRIASLSGTRTVVVHLRRRAQRVHVVAAGRAPNGRKLHASVVRPRA
ncbi:MAG: peptidase [Solirubrobacteraceae bacterium]|nr:peptidase [Solirubrobacteraceae bacterium]